MPRFIPVYVAAAAATLAACAIDGAYGPTTVRAGQTADDVIASMGTPTGRYTRADGTTRLEYARGPYGRHTYMIDLDSTGRVARWEQVLREDKFGTIQPGISSDQLLETIGRPSEKQHIGYQKVDVWSYRYEHVPAFCQWFQVTVNGQGQVTAAGYGPEPMCEDSDRKRK